MKAFKVFINPFETPQRSVERKLFFPLRLGSGQEELIKGAFTKLLLRKGRTNDTLRPFIKF